MALEAQKAKNKNPELDLFADIKEIKELKPVRVSKEELKDIIIDNKGTTANLEQGMYCDMDVMGNESSRLDLFKRSNPEIKFDWGNLDDGLDEDGNFPMGKDGFDLDKLEDIEDYSNSIKSFMFSLDLQSPEDIDNFIEQANETSLKLFKRDDEFTDEYVETDALSMDEKIKDIEIMIEYFIENGERYEDCAILHKVKDKIINHKINNLYKITN